MTIESYLYVMIYPKKGLTMRVKEQKEHESRNWFNLIMSGLFISPCNATMQSKEHEKKPNELCACRK